MPSQAEFRRPEAPPRAHLHAGLPSLRSFFARRVHANDVDDLMQDVALRLYGCAGAGPVGSSRAYLFQVARSVMIDRARRDASRLRGRHAALTPDHHPVEELSPARVAEGREQLALVLDALADLPERTRQVFVLHRFEQLGHAAIAARLRISVSAVEKHVMGATRALAACRRA